MSQTRITPLAGANSASGQAPDGGGVALAGWASKAASAFSARVTASASWDRADFNSASTAWARAWNSASLASAEANCALRSAPEGPRALRRGAGEDSTGAHADVKLDIVQPR